MNGIMTQPIVQWGFAGFAAVLLGLIVWLVRRLLGLLEHTDDVIAANTTAIRALGSRLDAIDERAGESLTVQRDVRDRLLSRPCLLEGA